MMRRVVVTGLGAVTPCGIDVASTWRAMLDARSGIGAITAFDASAWKVRIAGEVRGLDFEAQLGARRVRRAGRFMALAEVATREALSHAGFSEDGTWPVPDRFGIYIGSGIGGLPEIEQTAVQVHQSGPRHVSPYFIPRSLINLASGSLAIALGARGPSLSIATACATGNQAIGEAMHLIARGEADVMVAGGTEAPISPLGLAGFMAMRALSTRNDAPERASRPFDADRDGFVMSEGAGVVVLESELHARQRGAHILAEVLGYGVATDAHHVTAPDPDGEGALRSMRSALDAAGLVGDEVGYINAHGTSTPLNDRIESTAIRRCFGRHADSLIVSSTKGVTGHLLGAAGGVEAISSIQALRTGWLPPTANLERPGQGCDLHYAHRGPVQRKVDVCLSNAFGFGGINSTLVFGRV